MLENLLIEKQEDYAVLTINRPKALNALSNATVTELGVALRQLADDPEVRALIITGAGEKAFVAGADISELAALRDSSDGVRLSRKGQDVINLIERMPKPVIMAINGFALGGGCELAMAGDIRLAADTAQLGQPEINLGIIPGYGGTQRLPRLIGKGAAKLLLMTGERVKADEALRLGLVDRVVPAAELMAVARKMAKDLAGKAPIALAYIKECVNNGLEVDLDRALAIETSNFGIVSVTEDCREGLKAFLEKRAPVFQGK